MTNTALTDTAMAGEMKASDDVLLEVNNLHVHFPTRGGVVRALQGVNFKIERGKTLGVIGESGSGKSVTAQCIMRILPKPGLIAEGQILLHRREAGNGVSQRLETIDLTTLTPQSEAMRKIRGGEIGMIFQEPMNSLTPVYTTGLHIGEALFLHPERLTPFRKVGDQIAEVIQSHNTKVSATEAKERAVDMLNRVGIPNPQERVNSYPHQLSGGQRQRVMIAIALSCNPSLLIADEPTTALDVTTQAQINDLMRDLQAEVGMSILYITHDLGIIAEMAEYVVVMYLGRVMEEGPVTEIFANPQHPYTRALLESIPKLGKERGKKLSAIKGMVPDVFSIPTGCPFHTRCPEFMPGICDRIEPKYYKVGPDRYSYCLLHDEEIMREVSTDAAVTTQAG
jgi:oligopeptide/dipeptide ABC transporter ATP-binding protein